MAKEHKERVNIVYSTNPDYRYEYNVAAEEQETLEPSKQKLTVRLDKKQRGGKKVTLVQGFTGTEDDLRDLGKVLKTKCGVGGTVKDDEILIQGDFRDKIVDYLVKEGYKAKRGN
ncbi:MAG: translation initiation factor [Prevotellaceae bacterium]|jgi:translation initiation factor 1|nr:translation initiation factor [Prevotellaceae bacterium]